MNYIKPAQKVYFLLLIILISGSYNFRYLRHVVIGRLVESAPSAYDQTRMAGLLSYYALLIILWIIGGMMWYHYFKNIHPEQKSPSLLKRISVWLLILFTFLLPMLLGKSILPFSAQVTLGWSVAITFVYAFFCGLTIKY